MNGILSLGFLFLVAWFVAASVDVIPGDYIRGYTAIKTTESNGDAPEWLPLEASTFRMRDGTIVEKNGNSITELEDCDIFSLQDWRCEYSDGSGWQAMNNGKYKLGPSNDEWRGISHLEYHILNCRWAALGGPFQFVFSCGLGPFFR